MGQTHIESTGLMEHDATSTKHILDVLEDHHKPRSYVFAVATAHKLCLQEYIEKFKEVTATCNFGTAYDKCLWDLNPSRAEKSKGI